MNTDDEAAIVPEHARRVVRNVLNHWVVKKTPPEIRGQEMADLSLLGSDLPIALNEVIDDANPLLAVLSAWMLLKWPKKRGLIPRNADPSLIEQNRSWLSQSKGVRSVNCLLAWVVTLVDFRQGAEHGLGAT